MRFRIRADSWYLGHLWGPLEVHEYDPRWHRTAEPVTCHLTCEARSTEALESLVEASGIPIAAVEITEEA